MTITCIIPFFNERDRILPVLAEVVKIKGIDELLLIDDGSTDKTAEQVKKQYPKLTVIRNSKNSGKTEAIAVGLKRAKGTCILLLDADLQQFQYKEIERGVAVVKEDRSIDMIIFSRIKSPFGIRLLRGAILTCGQRIIKKEDLLQALSLYKPTGYKIEFALNQYAMDKQKTVYWMPISAVNTWSTEKIGFNKGMQKIIRMHGEIFGYIGIVNAMKRLLFFCRKEYQR